MLSLCIKPKVSLSKARAMTMAWYCSGSTNTELIENLFKAGLIHNARVKDAMIGVSSMDYHLIQCPFLTYGPRLIEPIMLHHGRIRTRLNPLDMGPPYQHRTCMAMHVSI